MTHPHIAICLILSATTCISMNQRTSHQVALYCESRRQNTGTVVYRLCHQEQFPWLRQQYTHLWSQQIFSARLSDRPSHGWISQRRLQL